MLADRFRITELPKGGGMATVWPAEDLVTGQPVVVKILGRDLWSGLSLPAADAHRLRSELFKRFERERQMLQSLGGSGIPRLLHHEFRCGEPCLVMERVIGKDLREFLNTNRPSLVASAAITVQILETLQRVHAAGVIHRDLKPANVVLANDGSVYLIDFGIALPTDPEATRHTLHGPTPGSIGYKAPELIRGVKNPQPAADVYGVGCMLFQFLTGRQVFEDLPDRSIEDQHRNDPPPRLDPVRHSVPADVAELIWTMLAKDPRDRPAPAAALDVLRRHLPKPGDPAPSPRLDPDPTLPFRRVEPRGPAPAGPPAPVRRRPPVRRRRIPSRRAFADLLDAAERALEMHDLDGVPEQVSAELADAQESWGPRDELVVRGRLVRADLARIKGDWPGAGSQYRSVERDLRGTTDVALVPLLLEARLGAAECLVPDEGNAKGAYGIWEAVIKQLNGLPVASPKLIGRCREFADELRDWGYQVDGLLEDLP
ncbi:serine/threonine-protein kinase [Thermoactinospora rubra]|uniref:serine/threonine-protein kinase n=1 Tax=Thermoactinospora rubra TaxID=1088767 RepID=UPI000A0FB143|nr:serine/threonine-protein kinase [Thermoactinospora rubra]